MASPVTNRINAGHSTGPRSVEGKAVSRFNAMKHGLDAASRVLPGEDPAELAELAGDFHAEFAPQGPVETELVETLIRSTWLKHRYFRLEAQLYETIFKKLDDPQATFGDVFHYDASGANVLGKLFRRQNAATRDFNMALAGLRRFRKPASTLRCSSYPLGRRSPPRLGSLSPLNPRFVPTPNRAASKTAATQPAPVTCSRSLTTEFSCGRLAARPPLHTAPGNRESGNVSTGVDRCCTSTPPSTTRHAPVM